MSNLYQLCNLRAIFVKLPALKAGLPGKEDKHFCIAPLDPALKDGACGEQAGQTFEKYIQNPKEKVLILRHDVDRKPGNALVFAKIEKKVGIRASYYFRIVKESYDEDVISQIVEMGHEIGYHYENLSKISKENRGKRK
ncbi:MAG: hypothetical protein U9Q84_01545 [Thermodesulfobacteriota bacterium]|nr:hypothetical protein [Thermodesulfobacteriota bacterium]